MVQNREQPGRPRSFDREEVLDKIVDVFWRQGFRSTTFPDVEKATRLHRQSLVYAFGSKRAMFVEALRRYRERHVRAVCAILRRRGSPSANIRAAFDFWLADARRAAGPGCLMVNTAGELGGSDADIADILSEATGEVVDAFVHAFTCAREAGETITLAAPDDLARLAVACGDGALLRSRTARDASFAQVSFETFLSAVLTGYAETD